MKKTGKKEKETISKLKRKTEFLMKEILRLRAWEKLKLDPFAKLDQDKGMKIIHFDPMIFSNPDGYLYKLNRSSEGNLYLSPLKIKIDGLND